MIRRPPRSTLVPYTTLFPISVHEVAPRVPGALVHRLHDELLLAGGGERHGHRRPQDRKSTRLNSSHANISYAVFCLTKKRNSTRLNSIHPNISYPVFCLQHTV